MMPKIISLGHMPLSLALLYMNHIPLGDFRRRVTKTIFGSGESHQISPRNPSVFTAGRAEMFGGPRTDVSMLKPKAFGATRPLFIDQLWFWGEHLGNPMMPKIEGILTISTALQDGKNEEKG